MKTVRLQNSDEPIAVNTIFCVGRNYAAHAAELNNPVPQSPLIFIKPSNTLTGDGGEILLPVQSSDVHFESEVVVLIGAGGKNIARTQALQHVAGYGIGIDVTARDLQSRAKEKSHPWTIAKGFDTFAPVSAFVPTPEVPDPQRLTFRLWINGEKRQDGNTANMLFPVADLIAYLSTIFTLSPGDLIFTGTPEGVGRLNEGDRLRAELDAGGVTLQVNVRREAAQG